MVIRPISDLRNTNAISEQAHKLNEPIFITKNGYGDMVVMSMELFESRFTNQVVAPQSVIQQPIVEAAKPTAEKIAKKEPSAYIEEIEDATQLAEEPEVFSGLNSIRERYLKK